MTEPQTATEREERRTCRHGGVWEPIGGGSYQCSKCGDVDLGADPDDYPTNYDTPLEELMTTDQTPDAVRAAIADEYAQEMYGVRRETLNGTGFGKTCDKAADAIYDRLAQMGALRPVGSGDQWCLPISTLRNWLDWAESVGPMCGYGLHTLIHREVIAADAAARAGDGAT